MYIYISYHIIHTLMAKFSKSYEVSLVCCLLHVVLPVVLFFSHLMVWTWPPAFSWWAMATSTAGIIIIIIIISQLVPFHTPKRPQQKSCLCLDVHPTWKLVASLQSRLVSPPYMTGLSTLVVDWLPSSLPLAMLQLAARTP